MNPARTQRIATLGTLCRRPSALLLPFAPIVLLVFVIVTAVNGVRHLVAARSAAAQQAAAIRATAVEAGEALGLSRTARVIEAARPSPRRILGGAAALFGGVLVAASMAGGTYAFLNSQVKTSAVTLSSGSLALTVQAAGTTAGTTTAIPTAAWTNMLPGDFVGQQVTVANTGTVPVNATARLAATTSWDIRLLVGTCPTTQITSAALTTTAVGYGSLAPGASAVVCVQATLPTGTAAAVENTSANFQIIIDATQVAP
jgi:hypothetical protein